MADELTWKLSEIRARFYKIVGATSSDFDSSSGADDGDTEVNKIINDYYQNEFPEEAGVDDLRTFFQSSTSVTDDGTLALAQTDIRLSEPVMRNDDRIKFYRDHKEFFKDFPFNHQEQFNTSPGLAIGSSDTKAIKNDAFSYVINGYSYSKVSAETSFSGLSTVPQNKYGAFALKIDDDGTITISEADDNANGYDSLAKAVEDLDAMDAESCFMGFVTVISTDSGGFVPGTTELDDSAVTATYTDGAPELRYPPEACCIYNEKLYIRPKADDIYQIKAPREIRPDSFANDNAVPADKKWGPAIALGAAYYYVLEVLKDKEKADAIYPALNKRMDSISSKKRNQLIGGQVERSS